MSCQVKHKKSNNEQLLKHDILNYVSLFLHAPNFPVFLYKLQKQFLKTLFFDKSAIHATAINLNNNIYNRHIDKLNQNTNYH